MKSIPTDAEENQICNRAAVYVMTHKPFPVPQDPMYIPVHVGRSQWLKEHSGEKSPLLSYVGDDTGDHISDKNCYYSELTGMYWVWKHAKADFVGTCHYRRYLLNEKGYMFTEAEIAAVLQKYDVITTKNLQLNFSYREGFAAHHKICYLEETAAVIRELYPEYSATFERLVQEKHTYFGNMLIAARGRYNAYMEWLFTILFEVERRVRVEEEDSYHRRIFGFISEFLQYVWITHQGLSVCECMVGMLGEKAEVSEVKKVLASYFAKGDFSGAKDYFLDARRKRPDLLMEASDVTGELHLCMEVIAIAGLEQQSYGRNLLDQIQDFDALMRYCNRLNSYVVQQKHGEVQPDLEDWIRGQGVTEVARNTAAAVMDSAAAAKFPMQGN